MKMTRAKKLISTPFLLSLLVFTGCAAPASTERSEVYVDEAAAEAGSPQSAAGQSATVIPAEELVEPELSAPEAISDGAIPLWLFGFLY